jgi:hypothetical protein
VAAGIAWVQWPRPPELDGERWFKLVLATLLRGRSDAAGQNAEAWAKTVLELVPYHPAGRFPERKISNPTAAVLPGAAQPGETPLVEALARRAEPAARWAWMYDEDDVGIAARLDDPADLGPAYDPATVLGADLGWDALAAWAAGDDRFREGLGRQLGATKWVLVEGRSRRLPRQSSVLPAIAAVVPDAVVVPFGAGGEESLERTLREVAPEVSDRLVLVGEEAGVTRMLRVIHDAADIRDQVVAVVSIGGVIGGRDDDVGPYARAACQDWLAGSFVQRELETDVVRLTPYLAVQWLDRGAWPPGVYGLPLEAQRFPEPDAEGATATTVEVVDLGPLPADRNLDPALVARALVAVTTLWVSTRRL